MRAIILFPILRHHGRRLLGRSAAIRAAGDTDGGCAPQLARPVPFLKDEARRGAAVCRARLTRSKEDTRMPLLTADFEKSRLQAAPGAHCAKIVFRLSQAGRGQDLQVSEAHCHEKRSEEAGGGARRHPW